MTKRRKDGLLVNSKPLGPMYTGQDKKTEQQRAADAYHKHLDECSQCEQQPFNQCPEGARLLQAFGGTLPLRG